MANKQIKDLTEAVSVADNDVLHINLNATSADRKISWLNLLGSLFTSKKATNTEAINGVVDDKLMTPAKSKLQIDERVATDVEAQDDTNNVNLMTPAKTKKFLETNQPTIMTQAQVVSGGGVLEPYKLYIITDSLTYTLPDVSAFTGDEYIRLNVIQGQTPTIQRDGTNSEVIYINDKVTDSSFIYNINVEIIPIYNNTNNRWEV